jgi:hypothetical protein
VQTPVARLEQHAHEVQSIGRLSVGLREDRRLDGPVQPGVAHHPEERGAYELLERDQRRDGIPRQTEDRPVVEHHEGERSARLHADPPEPHLAAEPREHALDPVAVADRDAAGRDHGVTLERLAQPLRDRPRLVGSDAEIDRRGARVSDRGLQAVAVRADDAAVVLEAVGLHELVPRRDDRHAGARRDTHLCTSDGGEHPDVRGTQHLAAGRHRRARLDVGARPAQVLARLHAAQDAEPVSVDLRVLLHDHGIGALRDRRARQDARGLARSELAVGALSGREVLDHPQGRRRARGLLGAQRVAVHRRVVERRDHARGADVLEQHSTDRPGETDHLPPERRHRPDDQLARLGHRDGDAVGHHGSLAHRSSPRYAA